MVKANVSCQYLSPSGLVAWANWWRGGWQASGSPSRESVKSGARAAIKRRRGPSGLNPRDMSNGAAYVPVHVPQDSGAHRRHSNTETVAHVLPTVKTAPFTADVKMSEIAEVELTHYRIELSQKSGG